VYGEHFVIPEAVIGEDTAILNGLDGRKMSKSYDNTIPLFIPEKQLRKLIMKIKTNSLEPGEPKDPEGCTLFSMYRAFATADQVEAVRQRYAEGIAWGEMKQFLFEHLNEHLAAPRERYEALIQAPEHIEAALKEGAQKARAYSAPFMNRLRSNIGISSLTG
jgi:tryptophanyl-tRNA synthetase